MKTADIDVIVELMVEIYGQQSVELTEDVLQIMNRTDLLKKLSGTSSGFTERIPKIPRDQMETADKDEIVKLLVEIYGQCCVELTKDVLERMDRTDVVKKFSESSSGSKGPFGSVEHEDCGQNMPDSGHWTRLDPEVNSTDGDESPTYSLQSEAGNCFECSVSSIRWTCKDEVSFQYKFCSWEEHIERMERCKYLPAGPLMNITVIAGKLDEVYLPHWICIDGNTDLLGEFAVLHIDDCGDVVEQVSEVTPSHVKLAEPVFSPKGVLIKIGAPVKTNCSVLIYKNIQEEFLKLNVYLIPRDPGLQQDIVKMESTNGYERIRKPRPGKSLRMRDRFILSTDVDDEYQSTAHAQAGSQVAATTGTYGLLTATPCSHGPPGLHVPNLPMDEREVLPEVGVKDPKDRGRCQTFPVHLHYMFGFARSVRQPSLPSDPTHHQVVIS
ncbi:NACHT, LRR and PYD domains-containing protein 1b allele 2-like [Tautogolabrus adspersus]